MKHIGALSAAGILLLLALFFRFCMVGYSFLGFVLACFSGAVLLIAYLPGVWKVVFISLLAVFLCVFCCFEVQIAKKAASVPEDGADYIILLGCGVHGSVPSLSMINRVDGAVLYLLDNPETIVIASGGQGPDEDLTEALAMKKLLMARGIGEERILLEERSTSTEENLLFSAELIGEEMDEKKVLICSSSYHVARASYLGEKVLGRELGVIPAKTTRPVLFFSNLLREGCGMLYYRVQDLF